MALEEHVSALQQQLEQSELDCVHKKAQIATLARLADTAPVAVRALQDPAAAANLSDPRSPAAAAQPRPDALRPAGAFAFSQVCAGFYYARLSMILSSRAHMVHGAVSWRHTACCWLGASSVLMLSTLYSPPPGYLAVKWGSCKCRPCSFHRDKPSS